MELIGISITVRLMRSKSTETDLKCQTNGALRQQRCDYYSIANPIHWTIQQIFNLLFALRLLSLTFYSILMPWVDIRLKSAQNSQFVQSLQPKESNGQQLTNQTYLQSMALNVFLIFNFDSFCRPYWQPIAVADHWDHWTGLTMDHSGHDHHMPDTTAMDHSGHTESPEHDHDMSGMDHEMMKMYFHADIGSDYVLFHNWRPNTAGGQHFIHFILSFCVK